MLSKIKFDKMRKLMNEIDYARILKQSEWIKLFCDWKDCILAPQNK